MRLDDPNSVLEEYATEQGLAGRKAAYPDRNSAQSYVDASAQTLGGGRLPEFEWPLRVRRAPVVFLADKA